MGDQNDWRVFLLRYPAEHFGCLDPMSHIETGVGSPHLQILHIHEIHRPVEFVDILIRVFSSLDNIAPCHYRIDYRDGEHIDSGQRYVLNLYGHLLARRLSDGNNRVPLHGFEITRG